LVLIDPPFEDDQERQRLVAALGMAIKKWHQGCYIVWRPIKDRLADRAFLDAIKRFDRPNILNIEHDIGRASSPAPMLRRAGLVIINPPYGLVDEVQILLAFLTPLLALGDGAGALCEWLTPPS
jgi:23S rRNA (adenine2030-N6)-methyltransferase